MGAVTGTIVVLNNDHTTLEVVAATDYSQIELCHPGYMAHPRQCYAARR